MQPQNEDKTFQKLYFDFSNCKLPELAGRFTTPLIVFVVRFFARLSDGINILHLNSTKTSCISIKCDIAAYLDQVY